LGVYFREGFAVAIVRDASKAATKTEVRIEESESRSQSEQAETTSTDALSFLLLASGF
jgi:hypothetical protein